MSAINHGKLHSKQGHGLTPVTPFLRTEGISSSCTHDFVQYSSINPHKNNGHPYKTHGAIVDPESFSKSLVENQA